MITICEHFPDHKNLSENRIRPIRCGRYRRKSDCRLIQRFRCAECGKFFSNAVRSPCFNQKKRQLNAQINKLYCSGVSQRRIARLLRVSRTTVARKIDFLGAQAEMKMSEANRTKDPARIVEFDDMETFEHTKMKPLSITLAVESKSRRILGFQVSRMRARGKLARQARKRYGPRKDERSRGRQLLFESIKPLVHSHALIKSDQNPHYPRDVRRHFPWAIHEVHKGQRGSIVGQGELKKVRFDPLFSLNHTCAMLRANMNRLFRRTWCTTKDPERLKRHIAMYANYHNSKLIEG